jgi:hypothetical protein
MCWSAISEEYSQKEIHMRRVQRLKLTLFVLTFIVVLGAFSNKGYAPIEEVSPMPQTES